MKFIKLDLLTLLIGLFLFSSCKTESTIGFEPDASLEIKGTLDSTVTVAQTTTKDDVVQTIGLARYPLGYISDDPTFGTTEASVAFAVTLPIANFTFGTDPVLDSAILALPFSTQFYGDTTTSVYSLEVRQLQEDLTLEKAYLSDKEWAVKDLVIGSFKAKIKPKSPAQVTNIVVGGPDTAVAIVPQIRIRLDRNFIQQNILNLDSAHLSKNSKFTASFKGLQVRVNKTSSEGKGGIMFIDFSGANANLELFFKKNTAESVVEKDTIGVNFLISTASGPVASTVKHDYTGTPVQAQLDVPSPSTPYNVTYLQALGGLRNKISFPDLTAFIAKAKRTNENAKIVINRAELVVNVSSGTDVAPYDPAQRLSLYRYDIAAQRKNIPDNDPYNATTGTGEPHRYAGSELAFGGFYETAKKRYVFTVTAFLQDLIDGKTKDYGTYLAPSSLTEYNLTPSLTSAARSVINTKNALAGNKGMKLNIYYTVIK